MTEDLLQQLEEKMMVLLTEVEELRLNVQRLNNENSALKTEKEKMANERNQHEGKLRDILSLLESVNGSNAMPTPNLVAVKPVLVQVE